MPDNPPPAEPQPPAPAGEPSPSSREEEQQQEFFVVGIGASAGGLEALTEFLQAMHPKSGMAFVVISHLDPEHKSVLSEILSQISVMPVREVENGMRVEPDSVYVMPPNRDMTIVRDTLHLASRAETRAPHMPVDIFLRSLAEQCGSRAIGVILSGTGSDGTRGFKAIKLEGGITFAQNETARFGGMPHSAIAAGVVDAILPPGQIAAELLRIAKHAPAIHIEEPPPTEVAREEDPFLRILHLLSDATGVDFIHYKHSTLRRRIERRMVLRRLQKLDDYLKTLLHDAAERQLLFEEVLIPVTSFFREPETYDALMTKVLPRLMANRAHKAPFRVWVPGCATGEEAYSIAICLLEYMEKAAEAAPIKIFATDISERAVDAARAGAYSDGIVAEVPPQRLQRYFLKTDRGYEVCKPVRDLCIFAKHDVTKDPPFSQLDLVSCRNVLIYLGPVLQDRVLPIFHYALNPGGILMLGSSETVGRYGELFDAIDKKHKLYARTSTPSRLTFEYTPRAPALAHMIREGEPQRGRGVADMYREADRVVLARYAPGGVVVDENYHVIQYRGDTGAYLKPAAGPPTTDLLLLVREGLLGDLRETLDRARQTNALARKEGARVKTNDHFVDIDLEVIPMADPVSGMRYFGVMFCEREQTKPPRPRKPPPPVEESEKDREISRLNHDLASTRAFLQSVIEQKDASNEELRAANEEVISANEELQATNEELTTVNDELQSRIRSTNQLADDLTNLIETTRIPIVVLGHDLCIRRFTPAAQEVMNLRPGDVGRPFLEVKSKINIPDLELLVRQVIDTLEIKQLEIADDNGAWHKLYIRPYKTIDHKVGGAVLMLIDIDTIKQREQEVKVSRDYAVSIVETVREPLLVLDGELRVQTANRAFYESFQVSPADTQGRLIYELGNGQWDIPALRTLLEEILPQNSHFQDFEVEHVFPVVGQRTMLLNACRLMQGKAKTEELILLAIEDVTARTQAEASRDESENRLEAIVSSAVDAIITIDDRGTINSVNPAAERMFGYSAAEMIGQNVTLLMPSPYRNEHDDYLARYLQTGEKRIIGISREVQGRRKDGSTFPTELSVSEYQIGSRRFFAGVHHDLSARKALEREVLETATEEQRRIAQDLHDVTGQELTALALLAEGLTEALAKSTPGEAALAGKISAGVKQALADLRTLARGLFPVEVDAAGLMAALAELANRTDELGAATCSFECDHPVLVADNQTATQLFGIAREAVTNALKHSRAKKIAISLENVNHAVVLRIRDDGVGLPNGPVADKGMGLKTMRYRVGLINGALSVARTEPAGTIVSCTVHQESEP